MTYLTTNFSHFINCFYAFYRNPYFDKWCEKTLLTFWTKLLQNLGKFVIIRLPLLYMYTVHEHISIVNVYILVYQQKQHIWHMSRICVSLGKVLAATSKRGIHITYYIWHITYITYYILHITYDIYDILHILHITYDILHMT